MRQKEVTPEMTSVENHLRIYYYTRRNYICFLLGLELLQVTLLLYINIHIDIDYFHNPRFVTFVLLPKSLQCLICRHSSV